VKAASRGFDAGVSVDRSPPAATTVVVSHNTRSCLERCLDALGAEDGRILVVDVASADGSVELVRDRPGVELISLAENQGYGAAANRGIEGVETPHALLLNADAWPLPGALSALCRAADADPALGVVAPRLLNEDGSVQRSVFGYPASPVALAVWVAFPGFVTAAFRLWRTLQLPLPRRRAGDLDLITAGDFPAGAALLIRKEAWDSAGGFDESFFMYSEETDLCERLRRLGWTVASCPAASFVHVGGASTEAVRGEMEREQLRSYIRFFAKHHGSRAADRARRLSAAALALRGRRELARWLRTTSLSTLLA
jgi:N-acetylglucosaminyl-diphospho-decaprenol L-rhamnosyltransferase